MFEVTENILVLLSVFFAAKGMNWPSTCRLFPMAGGEFCGAVKGVNWSSTFRLFLR